MRAFTSYSHHDYGMFAGFRPHLKQIERAFKVDIWTDHKIDAGATWNEQISEAISTAHIFFLLVSPHFIGSDYVYEIELPAIRAKRKASGSLVLPIVLKRCSWQMIASSLQAVPTAKGHVQPIGDWRPNENGYDRAREEIITAISNHFRIPPEAISW